MYKLSLERRGRYNAGLGYSFSGESSLISGLDHYWSLGEASGARADSVGSLSLSSTGSVLSNAGINGNAALYDRTNWLSYTTGYSLPASFTVAFWLRRTNSSYTYMFPFTVSLDPRTSLNTSFIYVYFRDSNGGTLYSSVCNVAGSIFSSSHAAGTSLPLNTWVHALTTYDGASKRITFYYNGQAQTPGTLTGTFNNGAYTLYVGGKEAEAEPRGIYGNIDEVGIWSRVLTTQEIAVLYGSGSGKFYPEF